MKTQKKSRQSSPPVSKCSKIKVALVDDHEVIRRGLAQMLEKETDIEVVAEATNATALQIVQTLRPDVVIVDISLKGMDGLEVVKLLAYNPATKIIVLDMNAESNYATRAIKCGAKGYLTGELDTLGEAVRKVNAGRLFVSNDVAQQMVATIHQAAREPSSEPMEGLSDRELQMAEMVGQGMSVAEIAEQAGISIKTVETHKAHMKTKLGIQKGAQLTRYCVEWYAQRRTARAQYQTAG